MGSLVHAMLKRQIRAANLFFPPLIPALWFSALQPTVRKASETRPCEVKRRAHRHRTTAQKTQLSQTWVQAFPGSAAATLLDDDAVHTHSCSHTYTNG